MMKHKMLKWAQAAAIRCAVTLVIVVCSVGHAVTAPAVIDARTSWLWFQSQTPSRHPPPLSGWDDRRRDVEQRDLPVARSAFWHIVAVSRPIPEWVHWRRAQPHRLARSGRSKSRRCMGIFDRVPGERLIRLAL